jgi:hypothetical protein
MITAIFLNRGKFNFLWINPKRKRINVGNVQISGIISDLTLLKIICQRKPINTKINRIFV